jgi:hypothetical protein
MQDTTNEMLQKQREIYFNKSSNERFLIGAETIDFGKTIVESSIKQMHPDILPIDLKVAVFKRYYENCFSKKELEIIINSMISYFKKYPEYLKDDSI